MIIFIAAFGGRRFGRYRPDMNVRFPSIDLLKINISECHGPDKNVRFVEFFNRRSVLRELLLDFSMTQGNREKRPAGTGFWL